METTDPVATCTVPSWLDVEAVVPNDLRAEFLEMSTQVITHLVALAPIGAACAALLERFDTHLTSIADQVPRVDECGDLRDGIYSFARSYSGERLLWDALIQLSDLVHPESITARGGA